MNGVIRDGSATESVNLKSNGRLSLDVPHFCTITMDAKHKQLLLHCSELLRTFNGERKSMEEHLDYYLQSNTILDGEDVIFVTEVFLGCICHMDVMKVVIESFFVRDGRNVLRSNQNIFLVMAYLALFRLDELGVSHFRKFVSVLDSNAAYKLLNFMFDERNILTSIKDGWNQIYETAYVQTNLISPVLRWLPELRDLVKLLRSRIENKMPKRTTTSSTTETKPFNLTKPRARTISVPEKIPRLNKSKPPPKSLYRSPALQDAIEKLRDENRKKSEERLMEASKFQFACAIPAVSDKSKKIIQSINFEDSCKDANKTKVVPAPDFKKDHLPVKMTTAAILRDGLFYQRKENEVIENLKQLEAGAYDSTDFYKWQSEKRQQDLEMKLAALEERRLLGKLSHEEAILAHTNLIAENRVKVQNIKKEASAKMRDYLEQKSQREKEMKMLVENTVARNKNVKDAKEQLKEYKQRIVQDVKERSRDLMKQAMEEAEAEMRSTMELIEQIRAMEATPVSTVKMVDLTSTPGIGLFSEMSIVELRERLANLKAQKKEQEEVKRDNIINLKQIKADYMSETMDMITKHKIEQTKAAAYKFDQQKKNEDAALLRNENLIELERKVQVKRAERLREQQKMQFLSSQKFLGRTTLISPKKDLENEGFWKLEQAQERAVKLLS